MESKYKNNETHIQIINDFLIQYDCKLQFYYTDITINLDDHKNPKKPKNSEEYIKKKIF